MADMNISDIYQSSTVPLPKIPPLVRERTWDAAFTHESLPDSNLVLAVLGHSVLKACVTEWLIDADLNVTQAELEVRNVLVIAGYLPIWLRVDRAPPFTHMHRRAPRSVPMRKCSLPSLTSMLSPHNYDMLNWSGFRTGLASTTECVFSRRTSVRWKRTVALRKLNYGCIH